MYHMYIYIPKYLKLGNLVVSNLYYIDETLPVSFCLPVVFTSQGDLLRSLVKRQRLGNF